MVFGGKKKKKKKKPKGDMTSPSAKTPQGAHQMTPQGAHQGTPQGTKLNGVSNKVNSLETRPQGVGQGPAPAGGAQVRGVGVSGVGVSGVPTWGDASRRHVVSADNSEVHAGPSGVGSPVGADQYGQSKQSPGGSFGGTPGGGAQQRKSWKSVDDAPTPKDVLNDADFPSPLTAFKKSTPSPTAFKKSTPSPTVPTSAPIKQSGGVHQPPGPGGQQQHQPLGGMQSTAGGGGGAKKKKEFVPLQSLLKKNSENIQINETSKMDVWKSNVTVLSTVSDKSDFPSLGEEGGGGERVNNGPGGCAAGGGDAVGGETDDGMTGDDSGFWDDHTFPVNELTKQKNDTPGGIPGGNPGGDPGGIPGGGGKGKGSWTAPLSRSSCNNKMYPSIAAATTIVEATKHTKSGTKSPGSGNMIGQNIHGGGSGNMTGGGGTSGGGILSNNETFYHSKAVRDLMTRTGLSSLEEDVLVYISTMESPDDMQETLEGSFTHTSANVKLFAHDYYKLCRGANLRFSEDSPPSQNSKNKRKGQKINASELFCISVTAQNRINSGGIDFGE
eukprot:GHVL01003130.1.p1 GENE.GHVL01003130.1~~GHVL01003130.1.p1  ORF type:complete len:554 (+),score=187.88 GHVL01003130.1:69-1730(+)